MIENTKKCAKCKGIKPLSEFHRNRSKADGLNNLCKPCNNAHSIAGYYANRAERRAGQAAYSKTPRGQANAKRAVLKFNYGITLEDYNLQLTQQNGRCAICNTDSPGGRHKKSLYVDHNHETGKFRALLCHNCNAGIGHFKENPEFMQRAIEYLKEKNKP